MKKSAAGYISPGLQYSTSKQVQQLMRPYQLYPPTSKSMNYSHYSGTHDLHSAARSSSASSAFLVQLLHHKYIKQVALFLSFLASAALLVSLCRSSAALDPHHNPNILSIAADRHHAYAEQLSYINPLHRHLALDSHNNIINAAPSTINPAAATIAAEQHPLTDSSAAKALSTHEKAEEETHPVDDLSTSWLSLLPSSTENTPHSHSPPATPEESITVDGEKHDSKAEGSSSSQISVDDVIEAEHLLGPKVTDWDEQRRSWLAQNPKFQPRDGRPNILLLTGSRPKACENPSGDHSLLIFMKNKVDYCRLHGIEIFYNMAQFNEEMTEYWSKLPLLRMLMLSHPEMEWLWWMDSDAMITDMAFELPMAKYEQYNLIIPGSRDEVFIKKSWVGLNAGIFIIRNCQWSLDLIDTWAPMGPKGRVGEEVGKILSEVLPDRPLFDSDDQSSLIYLLLTQKERWESKVFLESSYCLHGYWIGIVDRFEELAESSHPGYGDDRWPFITHFVGCKPCGRYASYEQERCLEQMGRAFNFADNQVLQHYGFEHKHFNTGEVRRVPNRTNRTGFVDMGSSV